MIRGRRFFGNWLENSETNYGNNFQHIELLQVGRLKIDRYTSGDRENQRGMSSWGRNTAARGRELFIDTISDGTADCTWKMQRHRFYINNIYMLYVSSAEITVWRIPNITIEPLEKTIKCSLYKCARSRTTGN